MLFNKEQNINYPYKEVYIEKQGGGYVRLDSYNPTTGEIVLENTRSFQKLVEIQRIAILVS